MADHDLNLATKQHTASWQHGAGHARAPAAMAEGSLPALVLGARPANAAKSGADALACIPWLCAMLRACSALHSVGPSAQSSRTGLAAVMQSLQQGHKATSTSACELHCWACIRSMSHTQRAARCCKAHPWAACFEGAQLRARDCLLRLSLLPRLQALSASHICTSTAARPLASAAMQCCLECG